MSATVGDSTPWTGEKIWIAIVAVLLPLTISTILGVVYRPDAWYRCLKKPCFVPPGWVFAVVWTIMYILLGVGLVAACYNTDKSTTLILPIINILVSLLFSVAMFGLHSTLLGMVITVSCFAMGIALIVQYATVNHSSLGWGLTIPYVAWTAFASVLAVWIYVANSSCLAKLRPKPLDPSENWLIQ